MGMDVGSSSGALSSPNVVPLIDILLAETHTCYLGDRGHRHDWGFGCGECPACRLRASGYAKWKAA